MKAMKILVDHAGAATCPERKKDCRYLGDKVKVQVLSKDSRWRIRRIEFNQSAGSNACNITTAAATTTIDDDSIAEYKGCLCC